LRRGMNSKLVKRVRREWITVICPWNRNDENKDTKKGVRLKTESRATFKVPQSKMTSSTYRNAGSREKKLARNPTGKTVKNGNSSWRGRSKKWELSAGVSCIKMLRRHFL
jgi:hypothetical protein